MRSDVPSKVFEAGLELADEVRLESVVGSSDADSLSDCIASAAVLQSAA